jgi:succinylglutamate desuccinylase
MTLLDEVKKGKFLNATCDLNKPFTLGEWYLKSGVHCKLISRGVLQITPPLRDHHSKDIILSSGVHGNETAPIELIQHLAQAILVDHIIPVHRLLLIIAHPHAINQQARFIDENMNRLFQGINPERNIDCIVANQLQRAVNQFYDLSATLNPERWHLDLHCAIRRSLHYTFAVSPYSHQPSRGSKLFSFIQQAQLDAVLLSHRISPTFSWFSAEKHAAQALTVELGKVNQFGKNNLSLLDHFNQAMIDLVIKEDLETSWNNEVEVYKVNRTLMKTTAQFYFSFPSDLPNFTYFDEGDSLGADSGILFIADQGGEAVVFPNPNVALGQRAALMVKKTKIILDEQVRTID